MKQPIAWHEECLKNQKLTLEGKKKELARLQTEVTRTEREIFAYEVKISVTKEAGKDGFDVDRFHKELAKMDLTKELLDPRKTFEKLES